MTGDNGWKEYKIAVLGKLDTHEERIEGIQKDIGAIKVSIAPLPKMADNIDELVRYQAKREGAREVTGVTRLSPVRSKPWYENISKPIKLILLIFALLAAIGIYPTVHWAFNGTANATTEKKSPPLQQPLLTKQDLLEAFKEIARIDKAVPR